MSEDLFDFPCSATFRGYEAKLLGIEHEAPAEPDKRLAFLAAIERDQRAVDSMYAAMKMWERPQEAPPRLQTPTREPPARPPGQRQKEQQPPPRPRPRGFKL